MNDEVIQDRVLKKCNGCGAKYDLAARVEREKHRSPSQRSRHDYCDKCQNAPMP